MSVYISVMGGAKYANMVFIFIGSMRQKWGWLHFSPTTYWFHSRTLTMKMTTACPFTSRSWASWSSQSVWTILPVLSYITASVVSFRVVRLSEQNMKRKWGSLKQNRNRKWGSLKINGWIVWTRLPVLSSITASIVSFRVVGLGEMNTKRKWGSLNWKG